MKRLLARVRVVLLARAAKASGMTLAVGTVAATAVVLGVMAVPHWLMYYHGAVHRVPGAGDVVALTFDDGPDPRYTPAILDALEKHGVKATFFVVGEHVERYPDLARRIVDEGHEIGFHSYAHHRMKGRPYEDVRREQQRCAEIVRRVAGVEPVWYRPPRRQMTSAQERMVNEEGLQVAFWSHALEGRKFTEDPAGWTERLCCDVKPGDVLLLHDGLHDRRETVARLDYMLERIQGRGLEIVSLGEAVARAKGKAAQVAQAAHVAEGR